MQNKHSKLWRAPAVVIATIVMVVFLTTLASATALTLSMRGGDTAHVTCNGTKLSKVANSPKDWTVKCSGKATPTPTPTTTSTPTATSTPTVTSTPTPTSTATAGTWSCVVPLGENCPNNGRGYDAQDTIPMSNGYNTYVSNQPINVHGTETVSANSPGDWQVVANLSDCGGCVQTYASVQQLTNNWNGSGWGSGSADTPLDALSDLKFNYNETSPATGASYEFAADIWVDDYAGLNGSGAGDIMFWMDTTGRCNDGAFGPETLGHATLAGQNYTVHRWGSYGDEIIFVLDGAGGPGTCAKQSSGSIPVKAGLDWLQANGFILANAGDSAHPVVSNIDAGWEITQASNATFKVNSFSIDAPLK